MGMIGKLSAQYYLYTHRVPEEYSCKTCGCKTYTTVKIPYSPMDGLLGFMLIGPLGLVDGKSRKKLYTCNGCGKQWKGR